LGAPFAAKQGGTMEKKVCAVLARAGSWLQQKNY